MSVKKNCFDVIVIGAGSVGTPTALFLSKTGLKTLVIDQFPSVGQGSNKHAIGGIRATHSDPSKIYLCSRALVHFSNWEENYGNDIEWYKGGYSFVAYGEKEKQILQDLLAIQHAYDLNITWLDRQDLFEVIPDLNPNGLLGGTFSPDDGSASPLRSAYAFFREAVTSGCTFLFNEKVISIYSENNQITGLKTDKGDYCCKYLINAAGSWANEISNLMGIDLPIRPDSHEAGITEAVQKMFNPMIVDIRPGPGSSNFYFYQHPSGKIIFCLTPNPLIWGNFTLDTSDFLSQAARRLIEVMPKLENIRIRRTWRGTYPMTPDGSPIIGEVEGLDGYFMAVGMCGQGFMLGPGIGELISHFIQKKLNNKELEVLNQLTLYRDFGSMEKLK
ncbi:MAG: FAD-binding oxidoreductase [Anaerolineaceae bacterium]|nr:FAD-binding oxidoreductase [Anaerolineaceae bacterium]